MNIKIILISAFLVLIAVIVALSLYCKSLKSDLASYKTQITTLNSVIEEKERQIEILKSSERINIDILESLKVELDSLSDLKDIQIEEIPSLNPDWNKEELPSSITNFLNNADKQYRKPNNL